MHTHVIHGVGPEGTDTPTVVESLTWLCRSDVSGSLGAANQSTSPQRPYGPIYVSKCGDGSRGRCSLDKFLQLQFTDARRLVIVLIFGS